MLKKEDLAGYSPARRRELYGALDLEILAAGKTVYLSGTFLQEEKYIQDHFVNAGEVRVTSQTYT